MYSARFSVLCVAALVSSSAAMQSTVADVVRCGAGDACFSNFGGALSTDASGTGHGTRGRTLRSVRARWDASLLSYFFTEDRSRRNWSTSTRDFLSAESDEYQTAGLKGERAACCPQCLMMFRALLAVALSESQAHVQVGGETVILWSAPYSKDQFQWRPCRCRGRGIAGRRVGAVEGDNNTSLPALFTHERKEHMRAYLLSLVPPGIRFNNPREWLTSWDLTIPVEDPAPYNPWIPPSVPDLRRRPWHDPEQVKRRHLNKYGLKAAHYVRKLHMAKLNNGFVPPRTR